MKNMIGPQIVEADGKEYEIKVLTDFDPSKRQLNLFGFPCDHDPYEDYNGEVVFGATELPWELDK